MKIQFYVIIVLCFGFGGICDAANILFFLGLSSYSHRITVWPLVEKLVDDGHNITFIHPFIPKKPHPKVHEFHTKEWEIFMNEKKSVSDSGIDFVTMRYNSGKPGNYDFTRILSTIALVMCDEVLSGQEARDWVQSSQFDLVFVDFLFNDCGLGLAHKFGSKVILFATAPILTWQYDSFGILSETNWISDVMLGYGHPMTFIEKVLNTLWEIVDYYYLRLFYFSQLHDILQKKLNTSNMPGIEEMQKNISLIMVNTHYTEEVARSHPPWIVPVGGMHCQNYAEGIHSNSLSKTVLEFIDNEDFIYINFGSLARISDGPQKLQEIFFDALQESKMRFVWMWEAERPSNMPDNVLTTQWLHQPAVLAHQKVKAFITHGGLMSTQESLMFGIPLLVFPLFADQDYNAYRVHRTGRGIKMELSTLTSIDLQNAISEITTNKTYKENLRQASERFKDRQMQPLETAVWWTNYVLRNNDFSNLKPLSQQQDLFQRRLLDVWSFILIVLILMLGILVKVIYKLFNLLFCNRSGAHNSKFLKKD